MKYLLAVAMLLVAVGPLFAQRLPGSNFDLFKGNGAMVPPDLGSPPGGNLVGPNLGGGRSTPGRIDLGRLPVGPNSVTLYNETSVVIHFNAAGQPFDIDPRTAKTVDLPPGTDSLTLVYSVANQQKQITFASGRSYALGIDAQKQEIVSR
jgi:hypothetical protein